MKRHVVLVGLPGAGKTVAGRSAAALLGAPFVDLDERIADEAGMSVAEIFRREGEAGFRARETGAGEAVLAGAPAGVAPGGGWAAQPGRLAALGRGAYSIYLSTEALTAAARLEAQPGGIGGRPLVAGNDLVGSIEALLHAREGSYRQASATIATDGKTPVAVAAEIAKLARDQAGW